MGPVMREGANSAKKPATVSATDVAARATGWRMLGRVRVGWDMTSRAFVGSTPRGVPAPPGPFRRTHRVQRPLVKFTGDHQPEYDGEAERRSPHYREYSLPPGEMPGPPIDH